MSIALGTSFTVQTNLPIDERFKFETIADMKAMPDPLLYDGVLSYNKETDKYYTYSSENLEEAALGKWREFSGGDDICYFNSQAEWEGAKLAGELDPNKYYAYPSEVTSPTGEPTGGTPIIYFSGKAAYEKAKADGQLDEATYYSYIGGLAKGSTSLITVDSEMSDTSENPVQNKVVNEAIKIGAITYFNSFDDWNAARQAGELDPNKYYGYPTYGQTIVPPRPVPDIQLPEAQMIVEFLDGSVKNYTIYLKED